MRSERGRIKLSLLALSAALLCLWLVKEWPSIERPNSANKLASQNTQSSLNLKQLLANNEHAGFERAIAPRKFRFPEDHGEHTGFRNEWWYVTGNLWDQQGNRYGFQLTFFRHALKPHSSQKGWGNQNIFMAHFAFSDLQQGQFYAAEKWGRHGAGVAGITSKPFRIWLDDWSLQSQANSFMPLTLLARSETVKLQLSLSALKPLVLQGDKGLSQKSQQPGNASYYYSFSRLAAGGDIQIKGQTIAVKGEAWLDREWSTSALSDQQQGWDWFALQLNDGYELMLYQLRDIKGAPDPSSQGLLIDPQGNTQRLNNQQFQLQAQAFWRNDQGSDIPIQWSIKINTDNYRADWVVDTPLKSQWLKLSIPYWEGAVNVRQNQNGPTIGHGFLEMTGY